MLIDAAYAIHVADIESVLGAAITGAFALEFAVDLLLGLGFLQRHDLAFGEDKALLRHTRFARLDPRLGVRQIMAQPDRPHTEWRDRQALFLQLAGNTHLHPARMFDRQLPP